MYSVHCIVYSVQCSVFSLQCAVYCVKCKWKRSASTYGDPEAGRHREEAGQQQLHILGDGTQAGDQLGGEALVDCGDEELVPVVVLHLEGQPAGEHAVEADTQGPHVHGLAVGHRLVVDLRSSVLGRSTASLELGAWVPEVTQPEVSNDGFGVILVQQDVFELDVSVNDLLGVEVADSR